MTDLNYDATVNYAFEMEKKHGWTLLQDTTGPDYFEIPTWIMQGYTALIDEAMEQLEDKRPTHIILQVGVGSFAGGIMGYLVEHAKAKGYTLPKVILVEPKNAACAYASAVKADGSMVAVDGDLETMVAGLACGELSEIGWPILARNVTGGYCWIGDHIAGNGMRALAREAPDDKVEAGECGGAGAGLIMRLLEDRKDAAEIRHALGIDQFSTFLFVNTEGYTDPINCDKQIKMEDVEEKIDEPNSRNSFQIFNLHNFQFFLLDIRYHTKMAILLTPLHSSGPCPRDRPFLRATINSLIRLPSIL